MGRIGLSLPEVELGRYDRNSHNSVRALPGAAGVWQNTEIINYGSKVAIKREDRLSEEY
jgi:hypothetical protein